MTEKILSSKLRALYLQLRSELATKSPCELMRIDSNGMLMLEHLACRANLSAPLSVRDIADALAMSRWVIRSRLETLAAYGFITADTTLRAGTIVRLNPMIAEMLAKETKAVQRTAWLRRLMALGLERGKSHRRLQGFRSHVEFGQPEPILAPGTQLSSDVSGELFDLAKLESETVAVRQAAKDIKRDDRDRDQAFVQGAANAWKVGQVAHGRMNAQAMEPPAWSFPAGTKLSPANARERAELVKLYRQYGIRLTGLAWIYFNSRHTLVDQKTNRPQFRPEIPHIQWVSVDKKPSHFAKHFNAILLDPVFRDWRNKAELQSRVDHYFGPLADWMPPGAQLNKAVQGAQLAQKPSSGMVVIQEDLPTLGAQA